MKTMSVVIILFLGLMISGITAAEQLESKLKDVIVDISKFKSGKKYAVVWGQYVVWIMKRTEKQIKVLENTNNAYFGAPFGEDWRTQFEKAFDNDPQFPNLLELDQLRLEQSPYRSLRKELFVVIHHSPYSGCVLYTYQERDWNRFYDPCSGDRYNFAGRIFKNLRRTQFWNLYIPPHQYLDNNKLLIGLGDRRLSSTDYRPKIDYASMTPVARLLEAAKWGRIDIVKALIDKGLNVESSVKFGVTPLLLASTKGRNKIIELLIEKGASPNQSNHYGLTPLHAAIAGNQLETMTLLASSGADVNRICPTPNCQGTPLNFAIYSRLQEEEAVVLVALLLKLGANPEMAYDGKNAFDWARKQGYDKVLAILEMAR